jgi:hypothetical protein
MPTRQGSTQQLAEIVQKDVTSIPEVVERLTQVYEYAVGSTTAGEDDGSGRWPVSTPPITASTPRGRWSST